MWGQGFATQLVQRVMWDLGLATRLVFRGLAMTSRLLWVGITFWLNRRQAKVTRYTVFNGNTKRP